MINTPQLACYGLLAFIISIITIPIQFIVNALTKKNKLLNYCCTPDMTNYVVIVTGSNTGVGYQTVKEFAQRGANVILACRDANKGVLIISK